MFRITERELREPPISHRKVRHVYAMGLGKRRLQRAIHEMRGLAVVVKTLEEADLVFALEGDRETKRATSFPDPPEIVFVRSDTYTQIFEAVKRVLGDAEVGREEFAIREAEDGAVQALKLQRIIELLPQNPYLRRLQHEVIGKHNLESRSVGKEPRRRVRIFPRQVTP